MSDSSRPHGLSTARLLCPWDSPGKNTEMGCLALLQGIFPTQESNLSLLRLLHCRQILYHWATGEAPKIAMLLSCFSRVRLCLTPEMAAHQAPPSLGFSRQEHWNWLPFPSPMRESENWKWSRSVVSDCSWPHGLQSTRLLHPWDFLGKSSRVGCHFLLPKAK